MSIAIVIFAKTPGYSKFKTRLARTIGDEATSDFYKSSIEATKSFVDVVKNKIPNVEGFIAVAETEAISDNFWRGQSVIDQGVGTLGDRQFNVYNQLLDRFSAVFFLGADSPHLDGEKLAEEISKFTKGANKFLLGPASDGGYYIFGGKTPVSLDIWNSVTYSSDDTCTQFKSKLLTLGNVLQIDESFDVDDLESLKKLSEVIEVGLTDEQKSSILLSKKISYSVEIS